MALQKTLLKKRLKYTQPLPPKTSFCDKTVGSRELIFGTIPIKKCMNNLEFFQPNLRRSSGEISLNWYVWRGMTLVRTAMFLYPLPDGDKETSLCAGWLGSLMMLCDFRRNHWLL